jgi:hypothetical protein
MRGWGNHAGEFSGVVGEEVGPLRLQFAEGLNRHGFALFLERIEPPRWR